MSKGNWFYRLFSRKTADEVPAEKQPASLQPPAPEVPAELPKVVAFASRPREPDGRHAGPYLVPLPVAVESRDPAAAKESAIRIEARYGDEEDDQPRPSRKPNAFDHFMDERAGPHAAKWLSGTISGTTHENADGTSRQRYVRELQPFTELKLEREPDNEYSERAIKILDTEGHQLGYVPEWLARDVAEAMDSGGVAACYVQHIRQTSTTNWAAAIGVLWSVKASPRTEFRKTIEARGDVEEWFWAKLSGMSDLPQQTAIEGLQSGDELVVDADEAIVRGAKVKLLCDGEDVATISKQQSELVVAGIEDGREYRAIVFEVRERARGQGLEPVVAVLLLKA